MIRCAIDDEMFVATGFNNVYNVLLVADGRILQLQLMQKRILFFVEGGEE